MLQNVIAEIAKFLIGETPDNYSRLKTDLYKYEKQIIKLNNYVSFDFEREVYIASFDLEVFTLDLLDNFIGGVKDTIADIENNEKGKYHCFINGPFFNNSDPVKPVGRRISRGSMKNKVFDEYLSVSDDIKLKFPACVFTDINDNLYIKSLIADNDIFETSKNFFESTPLFIDKENNINNFIGDVSGITADGILADSVTIRKGMPFVGISENESRKYLIIIMIEHKMLPANLSYDFNILFNYLGTVTQEIGITNLVFTDGSDSVFLQFEGQYYNDDLGILKNEKMPYFIGVRRR